MQFKIPVILLLASVASVVADTPGDKLDDTLNDVQSQIDDITGLTTALDDLKDSATSVIADLKSGATSIVDDIKDYVTSVGAEFKDIFPTITGVPSDVDAFFDSVETQVENLDLPKTAWNDIKTGLYPPEVSEWIDSLPTNMRAEASQKLTDWAEDVGNNGNSNRAAVALGAMGVAGVIALAMAL